MQKQCSRCRKILDIINFSKASKSKDGYDWYCRDCKKARAREYGQLPEVKKKRNEYLKSYYVANKKKIWNRNQEYKKRYPDRIEARHLIGQAVRLGYLAAPSDDKRWWNKLEFHHPDHGRPYYGCWLTPTQHRRLDVGLIECPPCTDYSYEIKMNLLKKWKLWEDE